MANQKKQSKTAVYEAAEFEAEAEAIFGKRVRSECVEAAFRSAGVKAASLSEAKKLVNDFMKKEVL